MLEVVVPELGEGVAGSAGSGNGDEVVLHAVGDKDWGLARGGCWGRRGCEGQPCREGEEAAEAFGVVQSGVQSNHAALGEAAEDDVFGRDAGGAFGLDECGDLEVGVLHALPVAGGAGIKVVKVEPSGHDVATVGADRAGGGIGAVNADLDGGMRSAQVGEDGLDNWTHVVAVGTEAVKEDEAECHVAF